MPIYGYQKQVADQEYGLLEMKEIGFDLQSDELRRVAAFISECADAIDNGTWRGTHRHIPDADAPAGVDIIVNYPTAANT